MNGEIIKKVILVIFIGMILTVIIFHKPIIKYLVRQSGNPTGFIGSIMTKIWNVTYEDMSNWGISNMNIRDSDYIIDVGCGGGITIYNLSSKATNGKVYGVDISDESIKTSIEKNKKKVEDGKVEITKGDVAQLTFEDESFDKVTAMQTHIYWGEVEKGFEEIYRVLKEGGQLLIVCEKDKIEYHLKEEYKANDKTKDLLYKVGFSYVRLVEKGSWVAFICDKK